MQPQRGAHPAAPPAVRPTEGNEAARLAQLLDRHGWDVEGKKRAAQALGIGIATLDRKLRKLHLGKR